MAVSLIVITLLFVLISEFHLPSGLAFDNAPCDCSTVQRDSTRLPKSGKLGPTFLLILIPHLCSEVHSRDLIRNTWYKGFSDSPGVMLRYVMGIQGLNQTQVTQLLKENKTHGDIVVLANFSESELALTNKTIALMKWATENVDFTYMMKCDDDTFVYVNNTIAELQRRPTTKRLYYGVMVYNQGPNHNKSKWNDYQWNLSKKYLPFARGGCYILSQDLVALLAKQSNRLKRHVLEDTAVAAWLAAFDYERRRDDLICFNYHAAGDPCRRGFHLAHLFFGKSDKQLRATFLLLQAQSVLY